MITKNFINIKALFQKTILINEILAPNKLAFCKQDLKCFIGYKDDKKLDLYTYFFQK